jgi:hypothetical protein
LVQQEMPTDFIEYKDDAHKIKHLEYLMYSKSIEIINLRKEVEKCQEKIMKQSQE